MFQCVNAGFVKGNEWEANVTDKVPLKEAVISVPHVPEKEQSKEIIEKLSNKDIPLAGKCISISIFFVSCGCANVLLSHHKSQLYDILALGSRPNLVKLKT